MKQTKLNSLRQQLEKKIISEAHKYRGVPVALSGGIDSSLLAAMTEPRFVISVQLPGDSKYNEIKYAKQVAKFLQLKHIIVNADGKDFDDVVKKAVIAIGRPIPHFNIYPLYKMYEKLAELGETKVILGDGPDETMCGYARDLAFVHAYLLYGMDAFDGYEELLSKFLPDFAVTIAALTGKSFEEIKPIVKKQNRIDKVIGAVDMALMRPDMDDMSDKIAASFGIKNIRPYQDNTELDEFMFNLPIEAKIKDVEYGKYLLRLIAHGYLPDEIAWRKRKMGGPVFPVNVYKKWLKNGEFSKDRWLEYQTEILNENKQ